MAVLTWPLLLCLAVAPLTTIAGMYGQPVVNLDAKTFKKAMATEHAAMVAFVAPWCGHCKALGPEYTAAAQSLSPLIPFYAVDCDDQANKPLCAEYQIQGFPTIKAFPRAGKGAARDYNGERRKGALVDYAKGLVPDRVKKLRADDGIESGIKKFLSEKPTLPHVLLVHPSTPSIPFLWKVLGHRLSSKMHLGFIRDTSSHGVLSAVGVYDAQDTTRDATRAILWQPGETELTQVSEYDGVMKFNALLEWLQSHLTGTGSSGSKSGGEQGKAQKPLKGSDAQTGSGSDAKGDAEAARRKKLDEAERRDAERRAKASTGKSDEASDASAEGEAGGASPVENAADPVPEEAVVDEPASGAGTGVGSGMEGTEPADPEPEAIGDLADEEGADEPVETGNGKVHEEL